MMKNLNLNEASAYSRKSPYDIYQEWEGIPVYKDFIIPDLLKLELGDWTRTGGKAAFANMDGAGGTCDTVIEEIAPGGQYATSMLPLPATTSCPLSSTLNVRSRTNRNGVHNT